MEHELQPRQTVRVDVSPPTLTALNRICAERGIARNLLIRQALALYVRIIEADERGEKLALVDQDHNLLHEIIVS